VRAADTETCRAGPGPHPDSDPHVTIIDVHSWPGRLRPGQAGVTRSTVPRSGTADLIGFLGVIMTATGPTDHGDRYAPARSPILTCRCEDSSVRIYRRNDATVSILT
jgi:hypothetical protein